MAPTAREGERWEWRVEWVRAGGGGGEKGPSYLSKILTVRWKISYSRAIVERSKRKGEQSHLGIYQLFVSSRSSIFFSLSPFNSQSQTLSRYFRFVGTPTAVQKKEEEKKNTVVTTSRRSFFFFFFFSIFYSVPCNKKMNVDNTQRNIGNQSGTTHQPPHPVCTLARVAVDAKRHQTAPGQTVLSDPDTPARPVENNVCWFPQATLSPACVIFIHAGTVRNGTENSVNYATTRIHFCLVFLNTKKEGGGEGGGGDTHACP